MVFAIKKIALDTSVLLQKKGLLERIEMEWGKKIEIVIPQQVNQELKTLVKRNPKLEKMVVRIEKQKKIFGVKEKRVKAKNADSALKQLAKQGFAVISLDKKLKKQIKAKKGILIELRGKKFFKMMVV